MYNSVIQKRYKRKRYFFLFIILFLVSVPIYFFSKYEFNFFINDSKYDRIIKEAGERNYIDPCLIKAVIWKESNFDRNARGAKGEIGLMQIIPKHAVKDWEEAKGISIRNEGLLFDPELNINIGAWYLANAMGKWKDYNNCITLTLCEYNAGSTRAKMWKPDKFDGEVINRITIPSTKIYVEQVLEKYNEYSSKRRAED